VEAAIQKITPFLWFDDQAEEAANQYISAFSSRPGAGSADDSKITDIARYGAAGPGEPGSVMTVAFELDGQEFTALNGGSDRTFTDAISLVVNCEGQDEVDHFWKLLAMLRMSKIDIGELERAAQTA
jgi:predicted 3-demethylubiquinone-9 3-methyltransferase (glyoxalase superfamily)